MKHMSLLERAIIYTVWASVPLALWHGNSWLTFVSGLAVGLSIGVMVHLHTLERHAGDWRAD